MKDVIFYEIFEEEKAALNAFLPTGIAAGFVNSTIQETADREFCPVISIRTQSIIPDEWADKLKGVLTRSAGHDHLLRYCRQTHTRAICGYLPDYCSRAVAEQAILMVMTLWRKLKDQIGHFKIFDRNGLTGTECLGKNVLVVGVGRIGQEVVKIAAALGMNVKGVDLDPRLANLEYVSLQEGLSWAQAVVCAVPLTDLTKNMFGYQAFKTARPGLVFVNVARGELSPIPDLKRLLDEKILAGIGMDVFENEGALAAALRNPAGTQDISVKMLLDLSAEANVLFTPHNAFNTSDALERKARQSAESVVAFFNQGEFAFPLPVQQA